MQSKIRWSLTLKPKNRNNFPQRLQFEYQSKLKKTKIMQVVLTIFIMASCIDKSLLFKCCEDQSCTPPQALPRTPPIYLKPPVPIPSTEGCFCEEVKNTSVICTGLTSCHNFPGDLNVSVPEFRLITTAVEIIKKFDLLYLDGVEKIIIEHNANFEVIEELSFLNLKRLTNLSISYNPKLTHLKPKTFYGAVNLQEIYLVGNGFKSISHISQSLSSKSFPSLYSLVLKENNFSYIAKTDFLPMANSSLQKLNLAQCKIDNINSESLNLLTSLKALSLGINNLKEDTLLLLLLQISRHKIPLNYLNLHKSGLRKRPSYDLMKAVDSAGVECLSLASNYFEVIDRRTFPAMKNLKMLDLRGVSASQITSNAFYKLPKLKTLLLADNKFLKIPLGTRLKNLTYLDLSQNSKDYYSSAYFNIQNYTFHNMTSLRILVLSYNNLQMLYKNTFFGLENLKVLSLKQCEIFYIETETFLWLNKLIFLDLEGNNFLSFETGNIFEGLENLEVLLLGHNNITYITNETFTGLHGLKHLSLNNNYLKHLQADFFADLRNLKVIDLSHNLIQSWESRLFETQEKLEVVYLNNNKIKDLSRSMLEDFENSERINLNDNKFICDCLLYNIFQEKYSDDFESGITKIQESHGTCFSSEDPITDFLSTIKKSKTCGFNLFLIWLPSSLSLILLSLVLYCWFTYREHFRYFAFLTRMHIFKIKRLLPTKSCTYTNYMYDAFVSYSNENSNFITQMVYMLEKNEPFFKLCIYESDFQVGSVLSETILENVSKSRKILLIISDSFLKSSWCQWETHLAQNHSMFLKDESTELSDSLILIKLGEVSRKNVTPTMRYLLKTRIFLQWEDDESSQEKFWQKLRQNLVCGKSVLPCDIFKENKE